jgi:uncharacterized protein YlxW (UPF0749 family)
MTKDSHNEGIILGGNAKFSATNASVGRNSKQTVYESPQTAADVTKLLNELRAEMEKANIKPEERQTIATFADQVEAEVQKEKPNRMLGGITANGLKEAAETVKELAPTLLSIATKVALWFAVA